MLITRNSQTSSSFCSIHKFPSVTRFCYHFHHIPPNLMHYLKDISHQLPARGVSNEILACQAGEKKPKGRSLSASSFRMQTESAFLCHLAVLSDSATPKSNHKNCIKNYFDLLKMSRSATSKDSGPELWVSDWKLKAENCKMPLKNSWVWKAAASVKQNTDRERNWERERGKVAATFGNQTKIITDSDSRDAQGEKQLKLARIVWATHLASPAATAVDSVNECLLKDNLLVQANTKQCRTEQNKPEQLATKREIRKMSENQSREQLICIGRAINMEPPAVSRERERERGEAGVLLFIHTKLPAAKRRNASWTAKST